MKTYSTKYLVSLMLIIVMAGCAEFLDEKPDISMVVPTTLSDLQGLLDDSVLRRMNIGSGAMVISADDLHLTENGYQTRTIVERQLYTWDKDLLVGSSTFGDWSFPYQQVFNANLVLDRLENIEPNSAFEQTQKQYIKGQALFFRAMAFHNLMEMFCLPYDANTAAQNLGIPLRKSSNINILVERSNLEETFQTILSDLKVAVELMPEEMDVITRPSKASAYALLSRVSMIDGNFEMAAEYARASMVLAKGLMDYNSWNPVLNIQFPFAGNIELLFHQASSAYGQIALSAESLVNEEIIALYEEGDLRKSLFFRQRPNGFSFKGNYSGLLFWFTGLALDEVYLNLAESLARLGRTAEAQDYLNEFLETRFDPEFFIPYDLSDNDELFEIILQERRKTLLLRPTRWMDLRRYNRDPSTSKTLVRELGGQVYTLPPNSLNFALPIPENDILLGGLIQNQRE